MRVEFTQRRQFILKLVVQEFVASATAVSSEAVVRKYGLPVSSATVRNDMAALEDLGYLTHLHTSAGRVPTDAGYRFFVEHLMDHVPLSTSEQRIIRSQFAAVPGELEQWIQLGASVLARTAQNASVVTPPQAYQARFRHLELIAVYETTVLLVLVLHDATVKQQTFTVDSAYTQEELRRVSGGLNECCGGLTAPGVTALLAEGVHEDAAPLDTLERFVLEQVVRAMQQLEDQINQQIYSDGLIEMLSQPEFLPTLLKEEDPSRAVERMRQIIETLNSGENLGRLIVQALASDGVQVVIGGEHNEDTLREYSVVLSRYGVDGEVTGVLGIIGPTRMAYPRSISVVHYISTVMSELLRQRYTDTAS